MPGVSLRVGIVLRQLAKWLNSLHSGPGHRAPFTPQGSRQRSLCKLHWPLATWVLTTWVFPTNPRVGSWIATTWVVILSSYPGWTGGGRNNNNNYDFHCPCLWVPLQFHPHNTRYYCQLPFLFVYYQKLCLGAIPPWFHTSTVGWLLEWMKKWMTNW